MKAYTLHFECSQARLQGQDLPEPVPGPGQLLVQMHAAGLNRGEFLPGGLARAGALKAAGQEGAGVVLALGEGVTGWQPGQRVMARCAGAFAERALVDVREALPVPEGLGLTEAAAVPLSFGIVHDMLVVQGGLQAGQWLLVTGISSGTGVAALQTAKALGAKVIGTSGSAAKLQRLQALGLDVALNTRKPDFAQAVLEATGGRGAELCVNTVGGSMFADCLRSLAFQGRMAIIGYVDGQLRAEVDLQALHTTRLTLFGVSNKLRSPEQRAESAHAFRVDGLPAFADGRIRPLVDRVYAFEELPAALAAMQANEHLGKIVVRIAG